MERNEMIDILNGMCERCLMNGMLTTLDEAKTLCDVFDRFRNNRYTNDEEYSSDIVYLYKLSTKLHENGYTSLEESYSIYSAILAADSIDFVESDNIVIEEVEENEIGEDSVIVEPIILNVGEEPLIKKKRSKKSKKEDGVVDISDISF